MKISEEAESVLRWLAYGGCAIIFLILAIPIGAFLMWAAQYLWKNWDFALFGVASITALMILMWNE